MKDLTIIYYTANVISEHFMANVQKQILKVVGDTPIISVSHKPVNFGQNIVVDLPRSFYSLYKQVLIGCKEAKTEYVAMAEDDMLYSKEHFDYRPSENTLAYDLNKWSIFSWTKPPIFSYRPRKTMAALIAPRATLIKTLEERFAKYPVFEEIPKSIYDFYWGEPGRFEDHLRIPKQKVETYMSSVPSVIFSTPEALAFEHLGKRKAHSQIRETKLEPWGTAEEVLKAYE